MLKILTWVNNPYEYNDLKDIKRDFDLMTEHPFAKTKILVPGSGPVLVVYEGEGTDDEIWKAYEEAYHGQ